MSIKDLENLIVNYKYVSFDVFDTLIFRSLECPLDVWFMIEHIYYERFHQRITTFHEKRLYAARRARKKYNREVTIDEIYSEIDYSPTIKSILKRIEKECENKVCLPNIPMISLLKRSRELGKTIVITSDMYLTKDVFEDIFRRFDIQYDFLFISCEEGATKLDGTLFDVVLEKLQISSESIIHIGDNQYSDIQMPHTKGIASADRILNSIKYKDSNLEKRCSVVKRHLFRFFEISSMYQNEICPAWRIGYTVLGPFLYSFCVWLHSQKEINKIERLIFVAREGYLIKKIYETIFPEEKDEVQYLCLNKNLLRLPSLFGSDKMDGLLNSLPAWGSFSWQEIICHLGLSDENSFKTEFLSRFQININDNINREDILSGVYREEFNYLLKRQENVIIEQEKLLKQYLEENGLLNRKIGLVNNSKNGNAQLLLNHFAKRSSLQIDVVGLQFISSKSCREKLRNEVLSYYSEEKELGIDALLFFSNSLLFEHLLFSSTGTARKFCKDSRGKVTVVCDDIGVEASNTNIISSIQEYSIKFSRIYKDNVGINIETFAKERLVNFFYRPQKEDALYLGNLWDKDVEGERMFFNDCIPYDVSILWKGGKMPALWTMGYYAGTDAPSFLVRGLKLRMILRFYYIGEALFFKDIKMAVMNKVRTVFYYAKQKLICNYLHTLNLIKLRYANISLD